MNVTIPPTLRGMSNLLTEFFEGMVHKLHVNSHKDAIRDEDIDSLINLMVDELQEFKDQRDKDIHDPNSLAETVDIANFCFLLYAHLRSKGVKDMRERFLEEFFDIDVEGGLVYCKKRRAGLRRGQAKWRYHWIARRYGFDPEYRNARQWGWEREWQA